MFNADEERANADGATSASMLAIVEGLPRTDAAAAARYIMPPEARGAQEEVTAPAPDATEGLPEIVAEIRALVDGVNASELSARYKVADLVRDAQANGKYGDHAVELLAGELEDLGLSAKTLLNYAKVAEYFPKDVFGKLCQRTGGTAAKPFRLTWTHAMFFAEKEQGDGSPIVEQVFAECLNTTKTREAWDNLNGTTKKAVTSGHQPEDQEGDAVPKAVDPVAATVAKLKSLRDDRALIMGALEELEEMAIVSEQQLGALDEFGDVVAEVNELIGTLTARVKVLLAKLGASVASAGDSPGGRELPPANDLMLHGPAGAP